VGWRPKGFGVVHGFVRWFGVVGGGVSLLLATDTLDISVIQWMMGQVWTREFFFSMADGCPRDDTILFAVSGCGEDGKGIGGDH